MCFYLIGAVACRGSMVVEPSRASLVRLGDTGHPLNLRNAAEAVNNRQGEVDLLTGVGVDPGWFRPPVRVAVAGTDPTAWRVVGILGQRRRDLDRVGVGRRQ